MKRVVVCGVLTALIYPFINFINGWSGATFVKISSELIFLSLAAGIITSVFFAKLLSSKSWKREKDLMYKFRHIVFAMFKTAAVFAVLVIFIIAGEMLLGATLPNYVFVLIRALSTVAAVSSFVSMALVWMLMQEPAPKPSPLL